MKSFIRIFLSLIALLSVSSCDYLDIVPDNVATIDYAFRNRAMAEKYLFTCYSYRPAVGDLTDDAAMQGDDCWWLYVLRGSSDASKISQGQQNVTSPLLDYWSGVSKNLWKGIRDCNIFLENVDKVKDLPDFEKKRWVAEVKFLKAYYHFYLLKSYGPIPIIDVNLPITSGAEEVKVYREPVDKVFEYIVNTMTEAARDLPQAIEVVEGTEAGRVDKLVALSMKAQVLLYAASPLFNGNHDYAGIVDNRGISLFNTTFDPNKWKLAASACKEAIDSCLLEGKAIYNYVDPIVSLAPDVFKQEVKYRGAICDRWNSELIWGGTNNDCTTLSRKSQARIVTTDATMENMHSPEWAPTLKMVELYYSKNGVPINEDKDWINNGWYDNRFEIRPTASGTEDEYYVKNGQKTVYLHYKREPRFYASIGFDKGIYFGNGYYTWPTNVKYTDFFAKGLSGMRASDNSSPTGYCVKKMHSFKNAQTTTTSSVEYYPFPVIRLADLYLMYAEALNEVGGPTDEVFTYLDAIRARAGLGGVKASWQSFSNNPEKPNTQAGLREIIHQERNIELAFEGKRFWDLRRWKQIEEYNVQPRGWNVMGENADDFYRVVNVAREPVSFSTKDYFWPIRESEIARNSNLIQNYGW